MQNGPHQINHSKPWQHQKQSCGRTVFYLCTAGQDNLQEPFMWTVVSCIISSRMSRQKRTNRRYPCVFVTCCDNLSKYVLNTLQFANVETGQTSEERHEVIKVATNQGISHQNNSLISQVLLNCLRSRI